MRCLLLLAVLLSGCSGFIGNANRTLDHIHEAGVVAREIGLPIYDAQCKDIAMECRRSEDSICQDLVLCHSRMDRFGLTLKSVQFLFINGKIAFAQNNKQDLSAIVSRALEVLSRLNHQLAELGVKL
jgi:hypothetical protein